MTQPSRRKGGLGRGLASLIPTGPADGDTSDLSPRLGSAAADALMGGPPPPVSEVGAVYREIDPAAIEPNPVSPGRCSTKKHCPNWCTPSKSSG